jgi:hypothetical protein
MPTYQPIYTVRERTTSLKGGLSKAPFITLPNGSEFNVWDIPAKEYTPAVEAAIKVAFDLGLQAAKMLTNEALNSVSSFRDKDK